MTRSADDSPTDVLATLLALHYAQAVLDRERAELTARLNPPHCADDDQPPPQREPDPSSSA